jgi:hypothetical protein
MKICFIAEDYFFNGGGERILTLLCNELVKKYDISILSLLKKRNESNYSIDTNVQFKYANLSKLCWGGFTKLSELKYLKSNTSYLRKFDIIIGLGIVCNILLGMIASSIKQNSTVIGWVHGSYNQPPIIMKLYRFLFYRKLDRLIILTNRDIKNYKRINNNIHVIPNFNIKKQERLISLNKNSKFIFCGTVRKRERY